ncbi:hypothetical protein Asi03nite_65830 [Actinoplanes siamensis]|uniref:BMP family ABC transporter substrate-binding protein n=1 Tax=Actinoplanes siamensis TaxID=1223317 RepID=A0A919NED2_9ACTN|nr:hypothetical protein Asi03nite_65830 [Actinoplanes siamensis]
MIAVAGVLAWVFWPDPEPRQREYRDATACLLTDEKGIAGPEAAPVWTAMSGASASSLVRVQYLAVAGPQTAGNATTYLNSLANSKCGVVVAVGAAQVAAVPDVARTYPAVRFATVGGGTAAANVQVIPGGSADTVRTEITRLTESLAG